MSTRPRLKIFISYRREEASFPAHQLYAALAEHFGEDQVFIDVDTIEPGLPFDEVIDNAVGSCDVLIAVIGPRWLTLTDERGRRRLEEPGDWVRLELEKALTRDVRVIPALLRGSEPPAADELPESLRMLSRLHAMSLSDDHRWSDDIRRLIRLLDRIAAERGGAPETAVEPKRRRRPRMPILIGALAGVVAAAVAIPVFALGRGSSGGSTETTTSQSIPRLGFGDYILVRRAEVNCLVDPTAVPVGAVNCYHANATGTHPRSYSGYIYDSGVDVYYYDQHVHYHGVYEKTNPSRLAVANVQPPANPQRVKLRGRELGASQTVAILQTHIRCTASSPSTTVAAVTCFYAGADGTPAPGSYAVTTSKSGVKVALVTPSGGFRTVFQRTNP